MAPMNSKTIGKDIVSVSMVSKSYFSNYQNESVITIKMAAFLDLLRTITIKLTVLKAIFLHLITLIMKDLSKYLASMTLGMNKMLLKKKACKYSDKG